MKLIDLLTAPPGNWAYKEPRTGWHRTATTFNELLGKISQHRANMKFAIVTPPFETLGAEIEDAICRKMVDKDRARLCDSQTRRLIIQPGDLLANLIHTVTGQHIGSCGICRQRMGQMNEWGWWGSWKNRKLIIGWICKEAAARGHPISEAAVRPLLVVAWRELHRRMKTS